MYYIEPKTKWQTFLLIFISFKNSKKSNKSTKCNVTNIISQPKTHMVLMIFMDFIRLRRPPHSPPNKANGLQCSKMQVPLALFGGEWGGDGAAGDLFWITKWTIEIIVDKNVTCRRFSWKSSKTVIRINKFEKMCHFVLWSMYWNQQSFQTNPQTRYARGRLRRRIRFSTLLISVQFEFSWQKEYWAEDDWKSIANTNCI